MIAMPYICESGGIGYVGVAERRLHETAGASDGPSEVALGIEPTVPQAAYAAWVDLVGRIQSSESDGMEELYRVFSRGVRFHLCRHLGPQDLDDKVHDIFLMVVQAIRNGELREPQRLMGFVRTITRRQVAAHIDRAIHKRKEQTELEYGVGVADPRFNPEETAILHERKKWIQTVLAELSGRDREILNRFYLLEQDQAQVCQEMSITKTQFRLLKSRAKIRFGELGRKNLAKTNLQAVVYRISPVPCY